jgi:enterochelin esterase-like enzyme
VVAVLAALVAGCGGQAAHRAANSRQAGRPTVREGRFTSRAVDGKLHYSIALPAGYASSGKRYPVIYFLHGLPADDTAYKGIAGYADSLARTGHAAIVVGAQGASSDDRDPEWHDWGAGRDWETATAHELVSWIDGHYRTLPRRSARAIIGVSAGGYGAALIGIHNPGTYQVIESWSGYFTLTDPDGRPKDLGSSQANADASAHAAVPQLAAAFKPYGKTFFAFYIGTDDPYPGFVEDNEHLSDELTAARIPHTFALYQGAHDAQFWSQHEGEWLTAAASRLDPPG